MSHETMRLCIVAGMTLATLVAFYFAWKALKKKDTKAACTCCKPSEDASVSSDSSGEKAAKAVVAGVVINSMMNNQ